MEYNKKDSIQHNNKDQMRHNNKNQMQHNNNAEQEYHSFHVILAEEGCRGALLLGDLNAASDEVMQSEHKVKTVITAASGLEHLKIKCDVTHIVFPLQDTIHENISQYFQLCYETIEQSNARII